MDLFELLKDQFNKVVDEYKKLTADGSLSVSDIFSLLVKGIASLVKVAESVKGYTGEQKKEAVLKAIDLFYDQVIRPIDIPGVPNILESTVVDPLGGRLIHLMASGIIDALVTMFNKDGWGDSSGDDGTGGFVPY